MTRTGSSSRDARRRADRRRVFRRTTDPTDPRSRLFAILIVFSVFGGILAAQLVKLQGVQPTQYLEEGERQRTRVHELQAYRGQIVDRNGFVLASSTPSYEIVANPQMLAEHDADHTADLLTPILGIDRQEVLDAVLPANADDQYGLVARSVDQATALQVEALFDDKATAEYMVGIFIQADEHRVYPAGDLAKPIVGRVDPDEIGIFGVEKQFDDVMIGHAGYEQFEGGRYGSISSGEWQTSPAVSGLDVVLTIDHRIQYIVEQALLDHCRDVDANGATAVLTEPSTGNILAMASVVEGEDGDCFIPNYNKALVEWFEPGSVLKTVTVSAAIEELGYTPSTMVEVPPSVRKGDATFYDKPAHPAALFPVSQIIANSMNVGTITIADAVGPDLLYNYQRRFGLGAPTGLEWPGETSGLVKEPQDWWGSEAGSIPIGQGITVTATQLVALYNSIANNGSYTPVRLVEGLRAGDGTVIPLEAEPPKQVVSSRTADYVTQLLTGVVNEGTGRSAAIPGYQAAGKTGTAWKVFDDGTGTYTYGDYRSRRYIVTFAGFVPADNPALSMVIVVDEPKTATTASAVAAPIFSEVGLYALQILGVAPDQSTIVGDERVRAPVAGADEVASQSLAASAPFSPETDAEADAGMVEGEAEGQVEEARVDGAAGDGESADGG